MIDRSLVLSTILLLSACSALECDLYIAESTIPNAGLGIFSAVEKRVGDMLGNGDVCFPLLELDWHNGAILEDKEYFNPFEDYVWDGVTMGMGNECEEQVTALWPGLDCAVNCNIPLENVERAFPMHPSHGSSLNQPHRSKDPGAGALTTYRAGTTTVKRDIPAGGELFKFYGDQWFLTRTEDFEQFEALPLKNDFPRAQALLKKYQAIDYPPLYNFLLEIRGTWKTARTLNALPDSIDEVKTALQSHVTHLHQPNATRSLKWLEEHGKCIDHIVPGPSTIPGAGEGAFAKRDLPDSTLITGSPVLVIPQQRFLYMYDFEQDEETDEYTKSPLLTKQVMWNYCFGHKESTMLLFPYGSGIHYINHGNSSQSNVRIQWAKHGTTGHNESWLEFPPEQMEDVWATNLGIDYIATRDIAEGEELFLDYGPEWEEAWQAHVKSWKPPKETTSAVDWNIEKSDEPIRIQEEQQADPYPETIELRCHVHLGESDWKEQNLGWERYDPLEEEYQMVYGLPCNILDRSSDGTYTVDLFVDRLTFVLLPDDFGGNHVRTGVPREAIFFLDANYESDLYLKNAFRQYISTPGDMMPEAWKNKKHSSPRPPDKDEL